MDIEEVHRLLDEIEHLIVELNADTRQEVDLEEYYQLSMLVAELLGYETAYRGEAARIGLAPPLLSRIKRMYGRIPMRDAGWLRTA
jgi:hypothetical protein